MPDYPTVKQDATTIKDNVAEGSNTASFVGQTMLDLAILAESGDSYFVDYNNNAADISLTADTWTDIPNNAAGSFTNTTYKPSDLSALDLIDTSTGYLDFTGLELGTQLLIRSDVTVTPQTNNSLLELRYLLGAGANQYPLLFWSERLDSGSGIGYSRVVPFPIYMGDTNTRDNAGRLQVKLSSAGTLSNAGVYISILKRA